MSEPVEIFEEERTARGPQRRCVVSRRSGDRDRMIRFVLAPDGRIVPDVDGRLPGRGLWLNARSDVLDTALDKNLFGKAARAAVRVEADLSARVEALLVRRCLDWIGLARRAHAVVAGFDRVRAELAAGKVAVLVTAADAAAGGRARLGAAAGARPRLEAFEAGELGAALGRGPVAHVAIAPGTIADRLLADARRLAGFRPGTLHESNTQAEDFPGR